MLTTLKTALLERLRKYPATYARMHGVVCRHPLPPGDMVRLDQLEKADRAYIRRRADQLGPVFKGIAWGELCVCIVGLSAARRFTQAHAADLRVDTMQLEQLIPKGFMCAMEGADHRKYRGQEVSALRGLEDEPSDSELEFVIGTALRQYTLASVGRRDSAEAFSNAMSALATELLLLIFYGAEPGSREHAKLIAHYRDLGPHGLVWNPQQRQGEAFRALLEVLRQEADALRVNSSGLRRASLLGRLADEGSVDDTTLGNLIYQLEMGRSDLKNFFRWLTRHVVDDPPVLDRIAAKPVPGEGARSFAQAFVLETLRTDQSERMMRRAIHDIQFDGYLIPRHTLVRLCLWESHHDGSAFPDPGRFDPVRFFDDSPTHDRFAPFGVDHHQCPFGGVVIRIGTAFVRALATGYHLKLLQDGRPIRGAYHWEPEAKFAVTLIPK